MWSHAVLRFAESDYFQFQMQVVALAGVCDRSRTSSRLKRRVPARLFPIGIGAHLDPMQGYRTFLKAAGILANSKVEARFVSIGDSERYISDLKTLTRQLGLGDKGIWLGLVL